MVINSNLPAKLGFSLIPEWYRHSATQLHWPTNRETWPGTRLERVEEVFLDVIEILHRYEPIQLFIDDKGAKAHILKLFESRSIDLEPVSLNNQYSTFNFKPITFHLQPTNDVWARDCGPVFVQSNQDGNKKFAIIDWEYNAWGGKYPPFEADNKLPKYVADTYNIQRFEPEMILEGGAVETNGDGVLLTTESVLLNANRNPHLSKKGVEQRLRDCLGIKKIIWLKKGLAGDDTDGHIDDLARFLNSNTILTVVCEDSEDVNYDALQENLEILQKATDLQNNAFTIETLPMPKTKIEEPTVDGSTHVPASYANFYIANGVVLVPQYDPRFDELALNLFEKYFPDRDIHGIPCADLVWGQGSIHCITQPWYGIES